jgi:hypothetical protein
MPYVQREIIVAQSVAIWLYGFGATLKKKNKSQPTQDEKSTTKN